MRLEVSKDNVLRFRVGMLLAFGLIWTGAAVGDSPLFPGATYSEVGNRPESVAIGDLNGDLVPDLAVANLLSDDVSVLLGIGDGTYATAVHYAVGNGPHFVAIGDLNGDQAPDLAVGYGSRVGILLGVGDGTFTGAVEYSGNSRVRSIVIADLDGDLVPDLITANDSFDSVSFLRGGGDGSFNDPMHYAAGNGPRSVAIGDLNGDQVLDLATALHDVNANSVSVLLGGDFGSFFPPVQYFAGIRPISVAIGDLDGDQALDLAVANSDGGDVAVLLGVGNGTFTAAVSYPIVGSPESVVIGDLDGDQSPDLAVAASGAGGPVTVLRGAGDGTFATEGPYAFSGNSKSLAIGDLDGDQLSDLAVVSDGRVGVLRGKADGTFDGALHYNVPQNVESIAIGDLNGDQVTDLAVANTNIVTVFLGIREGTPSPPAHYGAGFEAASVAIGDLNGDQTLDMVVPGFTEEHAAFSVLLGLGDGSFPQPVQHELRDDSFAVFVAIGDTNGDQVPDLAVVMDGYDSIAVVHGHGDGTFAAPTYYTLFGTPYSVAHPHSVTIGDLNGDEVADLVATAGLSVKVLLGVGDGTFAPWVDYLAGVEPVFVSIGNLNDDQVPDLAVANVGSREVSVLLGVGDGTFADSPPLNYATLGAPSSVAIGDLDGDRVPDLLAADTVLLGVGDGTFPTAVQLGAGGSAVAIGDMDGDQVPDVWLAGPGPFAALLLNRSSGACCIRSACDVAPHADCLDSGGTYFGHNTTCDQSDSDGDGVPNICDGCDNNTEDCVPVPLVSARTPHHILKNRYISVDTRGADQSNIGRNFDIRVTLSSTLVNGVTAVGSQWWAGVPDAACISVVGTTQPASPPDWNACPTLHLTGCPIIPTSTYAIVADIDGLRSDPPLLADTQAKPGPKWHGDCVGFFTMTEWTGPNGQTSIDDAVAAIKTFQNPSATPGCSTPPCNATHTSVTDVAPNLPPATTNKIVNIEDVLIIILAFGGFEYPGPDLTQCP